MNKLIIAGLLLIIVEKATGQQISPSDYQIYSKVINAFLRDEKVRGRKIVLVSDSDNELELDPSSIWDDSIAKIAYKLDSLNKDKSTFDKFELKNYELIIVSEDNLDELFIKDGGWKSFYKKYPDSGGIITVSKMFLSSDRTWGLIYISISRGGLNGAGYLIKFDLQDKKIIKNKQCLWVS